MELTNNKIVTFLILFLYPILQKTKLYQLGLEYIILFHNTLLGFILIKRIDFNSLVYKMKRFFQINHVNSRI